VPNGSREARLGVEIRNALMFNMYGAATGGPPTHRLLMRLNTTRLSIRSIPPPRGRRRELRHRRGVRAEGQRHRQDGADRTTFARVSYNIPGQAQRFARSRSLRDAEDRAAKEIADSISQRLASFFIAGT